jgi:hypothetical protein
MMKRKYAISVLSNLKVLRTLVFLHSTPTTLITPKSILSDGKSCAVERVLALIPNALRHTCLAQHMPQNARTVLSLPGNLINSDGRRAKVWLSLWRVAALEAEQYYSSVCLILYAALRGINKVQARLPNCIKTRTKALLV